MKGKKLAIALSVALIIALGSGAYLMREGGVRGLLATRGTEVFSYEIKPTDRVHGSPNASITIIEYGSLTCPHCADFQQHVLPQLTADYIDTGKVKFVFRDFPRNGVDRAAGACARCMAGESYSNFIDLLFLHQTEWVQDFDQNQQMTIEDVEEGLARVGRLAGMTREKVKVCMADPANIALVDANWREGTERYHIPVLPTLIINGRLYAGLSYDDLKQVLDQLAS